MRLDRFAILFAATAAALMQAAPASARDHHDHRGFHHEGHHHDGYRAQPHFGGHHGSGFPHFFAGGYRSRPVVRQRHYERLIYAAPFFVAPVQSYRPPCRTTRYVGYAGHGWRKVVTTRTCYVR